MQNPQVEAIYDYIRARRAVGAKEAEIRYELISHGHSDVDVTHYLENPNSQITKSSMVTSITKVPPTDEHRFKSTMFENPHTNNGEFTNVLEQHPTIISPSSDNHDINYSYKSLPKKPIKNPSTFAVSSSYNTWRSKHSQRAATLLAVVVSTIIIIGGGIFILSSNSSQNDIKVVMIENFKLIEDPNFKIQIPSNWINDSNYKPGDLTSFFYSPEISDENTTNQLAVLTVSVYENVTHTEQLTSIRTFPTNKILRDETFSNDGTQYSLIEYTYPLEDGTTQHTSYVIAVRGNGFVHANVSTQDANWSLHADNIDKILRSLIPIPQEEELPKESEIPADATSLEPINSGVDTPTFEMKVPTAWSTLQGENRVDLYSESEGSAAVYLNDTYTSELNSSNLLNKYTEQYTETYEINGYNYIYSDGETTSVESDDTKFNIAYIIARKGETVHTAIYVTTTAQWESNRQIAREMLKSIKFK